MGVELGWSMSLPCSVATSSRLRLFGRACSPEEVTQLVLAHYPPCSLRLADGRTNRRPPPALKASLFRVHVSTAAGAPAAGPASAGAPPLLPHRGRHHRHHRAVLVALAARWWLRVREPRDRIAVHDAVHPVHAAPHQRAHPGLGTPRAPALRRAHTAHGDPNPNPNPNPSPNPSPSPKPNPSYSPNPNPNPTPHPHRTPNPRCRSMRSTRGWA